MKVKVTGQYAEGKIKPIKLYQWLTNASLYEAKTFVEQQLDHQLVLANGHTGEYVFNVETTKTFDEIYQHMGHLFMVDTVC